MSYCRHNGKSSQAYVIHSLYGTLECLGCRISGEPMSNGIRYGTFVTYSRMEMIKHLQQHRQLKFKVPFGATRRLKREIRDFGDDTRGKEASQATEV